jgi:hypothetical protein
VHGHKRALRETALVLVGDSCTDDGNRNVARELLHVLVDRYV